MVSHQSLVGQQIDTVSIKMKRHAIGATKAITSDLDGFTWFATQFGLLRFDGEQFKSIEELAPNLHLPDNDDYITIHVDRSNQLWILTWEHLYRVDLNSYQLELFQDFPPIGEVPLSYQILEQDNGRIYFPHHQQVIQYEPRGDSLIIHKLNLEKESTLLNQIVEIENDLLCLGDMMHTYYWNIGENSLRTIDFNVPLNRLKNIIAYDGNGNLWINTWYDKEYGLIKYNIVKDAVVAIFNTTTGSQHYLGNTDIWEMKFLGDYLWLAANSGLWRIHTGTYQVDYLALDEALSSSNRVNQLRSLHIDSDQNVWIGSNVNVYHTVKNEKRFKILKPEPDRPNTLITSPTTTIADIGQQRIAIGTADGISVYDTEHNSFENFRLPYYNGNPYNNYITAIEKKNEESYWVGTWSGLFLINNKTQSTIKYYVTFQNAGSNHPASVSHQHVGAVHDLFMDDDGDDDGVLWMINNSGTIYRLIESQSKDHFEMIEVQNAANGYFSKILKSHDFGILAIRNTGHRLWKFDEKENMFQPLITNVPKLDEGDLTGISNMYGGRLLVVTNNQLFSLYKMGKVDTCELLAELPTYQRLSNPVIGLDQNVWLPTKNGILKFDLSTKQEYFFENELYMGGIGFDVTSGFGISTRSESGKIYFASVDGVVEIDPQAINFDVSQPRLMITSIESNGNRVTELPSHKVTDLTLRPNQDNLLVRFNTVNDQLPNKTEYKYQLNGSGDQWIDIGTENSIALSGLSPGPYRLDLKATSSDGVESQQATVLEFNLKPPIYRTYTAYALYLFSFLGLTYLVYRWQLNQKLKREKLRTNISRNLHDEVGGILSGIAMKSDLAQMPNIDTKKEVEEIASLSRRALRKMRDVLWSIDARKDTAEDLIDKMKEHAAELCGIANIAYGFNAEGIHDGRIDSEVRQNIYLIFKEALNNVVKHAEATKLDIKIMNDHQFQMKIQDNGIGQVVGPQSSGQGLENMKFRAKELKGSIIVKFDDGGLIELQCPRI